MTASTHRIGRPEMWYANCVGCSFTGKLGSRAEAAAEAKLHNEVEHFAEVREKLISRPGQRLEHVYRAVCDECSWCSDDWATPSSAAQEARRHNGIKHRAWFNPRLKISQRNETHERVLDGIQYGVAYVKPEGNAIGGWQATCWHAGCHWKCPAYYTEDAAERMGARHIKARHTEKEIPMRDKHTVDTAIELAEARLAALLEERAKIEKLPREPEHDNIVVTFRVRFDEHSQTRYSYAAIRARGLWFLTGAATRGKTWAEILELAGQDVDVIAGRRRLSFEEFLPGTGFKSKAQR